MKKTLVLLLAALALLAVVLLKIRSDQQSSLGAVFALDSAKIDDARTVTIVKKTDTAALAWKDGKWTTAADAFPVDTAKINKVLKYVFGLQSKEIASLDPLQPEEYGLDTAEAKHVAVRDAAGKALAEVVIGKTSGADFSSTYWRWEGKPEVYRTPGNFTWEIATRANDWKDRKLYALDVKNVKTVEVTWKDSTESTYHYKLEALNDSVWKRSDPADTGKVQQRIINDVLARLGEMGIDEFVAQDDTNAAKAETHHPRMWIKVGTKDGRPLELKAGAIFEGYYYVQHPSLKNLVKLLTWRFDPFKKQPAELMEGYVPPPPAPAKNVKPVKSGKKTKKK